jgi:hypothetical protein
MKIMQNGKTITFISDIEIEKKSEKNRRGGWVVVHLLI